MRVHPRYLMSFPAATAARAFLAPSSPCTAVADDDLRKLTRENSNFSAPTMNHGLLQTTSITTSIGHNL